MRRSVDSWFSRLVVPVVQVDFDIVEDFDASARGAGGFGSTG